MREILIRITHAKACASALHCPIRTVLAEPAYRVVIQHHLTAVATAAWPAPRIRARCSGNFFFPFELASLAAPGPRRRTGEPGAWGRSPRTFLTVLIQRNALHRLFSRHRGINCHDLATTATSRGRAGFVIDALEHDGSLEIVTPEGRGLPGDERVTIGQWLHIAGCCSSKQAVRRRCFLRSSSRWWLFRSVQCLRPARCGRGDRRAGCRFQDPPVSSCKARSASR